MDFSNLLHEAEGLATGTSDTPILRNINIPSMVEQYINQNGLNVSPAGLKSIMDNPAVKQGIENAVKSYAMGKVPGNANQNNMIAAHLGPVVDTILAHSTGVQNSKQEVISALKDHILSSLHI